MNVRPRNAVYLLYVYHNRTSCSSHFFWFSFGGSRLRFSNGRPVIL